MSDSEKEGPSSGNGVQSERLDLPAADAQRPETMAGPVKSLLTPAPAAVVDPATAKAVEGVLFSDVRAVSFHRASLTL